MDQYTKWEEANNKAIKSIKSYLKTQDIDTHSEEYRNFRTLANWVMATEENPWGFMPQGWEGAKGSAQSFESFLHYLHHAMIDDGDVCFVDDPTHGPCMEFTFWMDEKEGEGVYLNHHRKCYEDQDQRMRDMLERCGNPAPEYSSVADIEYHTDIQRFIRGFEIHRIKSEETWAKNEKWMKSLEGEDA